MIIIENEKMVNIADIALIVGFTPNLIIPQMTIGVVLCTPTVKKVTTNSSNERAKANNAAPKKVGLMIGNITRRKTCTGFAPRSRLQRLLLDGEAEDLRWFADFLDRPGFELIDK